jgi:hypothetical protein
MTAKLSKNGRALKSKFEAALLEYRQKKPVYIDLKLTSSTLKDDAMANIERARSAIHNDTLAQLFTFGLLIHMKRFTPDYHRRDHVNATFLYEFFKEEDLALPHLRDVSNDMLNRISAHDKKEIVRTRSRPTDPVIIELESSTAEVQGLDSIRPGDVWYSGENPLDLPSYAPPFILEPSAENPSDAAVLDWIFGSLPPLDAPSQDERNEPKHALVAAPDHEQRPLKRRRTSLDNRDA